jgi:hypothetical protein
MSSRLPSSGRFLRRIAIVLGTSALLTACFTGERPTLEEQESAPVVSSGNAEIDVVLGLLDSVGSSEFTAGYQIDTKFNTVSSTGLVVQAAGQRRSITVENDERSVRFIVDGPDERTCDLTTAECEVALNDARISDTQLPHTFYGPAFAARLRADADRRIGDPAVYDKVIAGQTATCVDVVVAGGTKTYCALQSGPLAEFIGADVNIELTSYSPEPDTTKFTSN